jgi:bifunctional non-homologous end joining protein LigD
MARGGLGTYRLKRRFTKTPEPRGRVARPGRPAGLAYVIQKHDATRLHYDFRLELDGVMKSWAVPRGPSLDPKIRRMAVHVEDHPIEYNRFEGVIPKGEYGGGPVLLWDRGVWIPEGDARAAYDKGTLKFRLEGEKLHGSWVLVRTLQTQGTREQWLLIKHQDDAARPNAKKDIVVQKPRSVVSGRTIEEIGPSFHRRNGRPAASRVTPDDLPVYWVRPKLVADVAFMEKTRDGILRHPRFRGLREDKSPRETRGEAAGAELDAAGRGAAAGPRLTNPDKVLYPEDGVTKRRLIDYYLEAQDRLMPYAKDRPLTVYRCPEGIGRFCFWEKHRAEALPRGLAPISLDDPRTEKERGPYFYATSIEGILALVQLGTLEFHVWGSRASKVESPDLMIFDIDPDVGLDWARVVEATATVRRRLEELGLRSWLKTTGGKGLHVCVPLGRRQDWVEVKAFAKAVSEDIVRREPLRYTASLPKARRKGRIFIDYLRNGRGATAIAAWSTRARKGAPVSMPLSWDELEDRNLRPDRFTVGNARDRLRGRDPWKGFYACRQTITAAMRASLER